MRSFVCLGGFVVLGRVAGPGGEGVAHAGDVRAGAAQPCCEVGVTERIEAACGEGRFERTQAGVASVGHLQQESAGVVLQQ